MLVFLVAVLYTMGQVWVMYLALQNIIDHREKLTLPAKVFAYPAFIIGYAMDILLNLILGSIFFKEMPDIPSQEDLKHFNLECLTFTYRCVKHMKEDSWRGAEARWWCENFLDPFTSSGVHCK